MTQPIEPAPVMGWGSDAFAAVIHELGIEYVTLNPGASFRGLHDSIVNYTGNVQPEMLLCLHEEHAIAIAHGYAKVTGKPLLSIVHSNVGLMHASMAIFNAWCDRVPMVILGATGPIDAKQRRPWIDWLHTSQDQGALVRGYTKWDDTPGSVPAAVDSVLRAWQYATTLPCAPTYVVFDAALQEQRLEGPLEIPDPQRFRAPQVAYPAPGDVDRVLELLRAAKRPVILAGRVSRRVSDWNARIALAEAFNARVVTDFKVPAAFPSDHVLYLGPPGNFAEPEVVAGMRAADFILNLDFFDFAGLLQQVWQPGDAMPTIVSTSLDRYVHNGWSMDYMGLAPAELDLAVDPDALTSALLARLGVVPHETDTTSQRDRAAERNATPTAPGDERIGLRTLAAAVAEAVGERDRCYIRLPLGMQGAHYTFRHPLDYLGFDGGGGVGSGPGMAVGAALALRGTGRLPIAIIGDGDFLMSCTAVWTASAHNIPLLLVIVNNGSYFSDEVHQERMAKLRGRPVERKGIGQRLDSPAPDIAGLARDQGAVGIGMITRRADLLPAIERAIAEVEAGRICVVDVQVTPGFDAGAGRSLFGGTTERPSGSSG
jgi:thiamine pyrophosphate-dependent acetolactate synthase large subunit-like protein